MMLKINRNKHEEQKRKDRERQRVNKALSSQKIQSTTDCKIKERKKAEKSLANSPGKKGK